MTEPNGQHTLEPEEVQERCINTDQGESLLLNDRTVPLKVTGSHISKSNMTYRDDNYVVELAGNQTEYHLICTEGGSHGPMLYKKSDWDKTENERGETEYNYRRGERIEYAEVL